MDQVQASKEAAKREAAAPPSKIANINKARRFYLRGEQLREESLLNMIESIEQYERGIAVLEKMKNLEGNEEGVKLMVTLKDILSTNFQLKIRGGISSPFLGMGMGMDGSDGDGNEHMSIYCRAVISHCTYVLKHREHATKFQIQNCRSKRMGCACILQTKLGSRQRVTEHEMAIALSDVDVILNEGDSTYGISWGDSVRELVLEVQFAMAVPNLEICAMVKGCKCKTKKPDKLFLCGRCKSVKYCCRDCQVGHYEDHKQVCKRIAAKNKLVLVD